MSYVTIVWSMVAACALVFALMHSVIWLLDRRAFANLAFAIISYSGIGMAFVELHLMRSQTAAEYAEWIRWFQAPTFSYIVGTMIFVRLYLRTGRVWLLWTAGALRLGILVVNFAVKPNFNYQSVDSIAAMDFLGEQIAIVDHAVTSPRQVFATIATLLSLLFFVDAAVSRWRQRTRDAQRQALVIGGGVVSFYVFAILNSQLTVWGLIKSPTLIAPPFLIAIGAMIFEMSRDSLRGARLTRELHESERSLRLAATAAGLGLWSWDARRARIWATKRAREMFGINSRSDIQAEQLLPFIHSDDLARVLAALDRALTTRNEQTVQFRVVSDGQPTRWFMARGQSEFDARDKLTLIQGVLRDVTDQRRLQEETEELRSALNHAGRVMVLGQLASALVHDLSQPVGAILLNVSSAQTLLEKSNPDMEELRATVADIYRDNRHAGEIIDKMRTMMKRRPMTFTPVAVNRLVNDVLVLVRNDAVARGVALDAHLDTEFLMVSGDKVHLAQVLINLVINSMDAMIDTAAHERLIVIRTRATEDRWIEIAVTDRGTGLSESVVEKIFSPFYTTKTSGMGMGLSISRTIVEAHHGRLWATNNVGSGATFHLTIPAAPGG